MVVPKRCLFCRSSSSTRPLSETQWGLGSLGALLRLPPKHALRSVFASASACPPCLLPLIDIHFTLRQLQPLLQRIQQRHKQLLHKLGENLQKIPTGRVSEDLSYRELDEINRKGKPVAYSFDQIVYMMFHKFKDESDELYSALDQINILFGFKGKVTTDQNDPVPVKSSSSKKRKLDLESALDNTDVEVKQEENVDKDSSMKTRRQRVKKERVDYHYPDLDLENIDADLPSPLPEQDDRDNDPDWGTGSEAEDKVNPNVDVERSAHPLRKNDKEGKDKNLDSSDSEWSYFEEAQEGKRKVKVYNFSCPVCHTRFETEDGMLGHKRKWHENDPMPYHCTVNGCKKKFKRLTSLSKHRLKHGIKFPCEQCDKIYNLKDSLKMHILQNHSDSNPRNVKNPCSFCGLGFSSQEELGVHEEVHKNNVTPFSCTICQEVCTNSLRLHTHVKESHTMKDFYVVCDACGQKFTTKQNLRRHKLLKHDDSFQKLTCSVENCNYVTVSKSVLKLHMYKHTATKSFICEICGNGYWFLKALKRHRITHQDKEEFPCQCKICGAKFAYLSGLQNHEEVHSGTLTYCCQTCGKLFKAKSSLDQHERTHLPVNRDRVSAKRRKMARDSKSPKMSRRMPKSKSKTKKIEEEPEAECEFRNSDQEDDTDYQDPIGQGAAVIKTEMLSMPTINPQFLDLIHN